MSCSLLSVKRTFAIRFATCSWTQSLRDLSVGAFNSHWHKHPPHPPLSAPRTWSGECLSAFKICFSVSLLFFPLPLYHKKARKKRRPKAPSWMFLIYQKLLHSLCGISRFPDLSADDCHLLDHFVRNRCDISTCECTLCHMHRVADTCCDDLCLKSIVVKDLNNLLNQIDACCTDII